MNDNNIFVLIGIGFLAYYFLQKKKTISVPTGQTAETQPDVIEITPEGIQENKSGRSSGVYRSSATALTQSQPAATPVMPIEDALTKRSADMALLPRPSRIVATRSLT